jgi:hypothetical protein
MRRQVRINFSPGAAKEGASRAAEAADEQAQVLSRNSRGALQTCSIVFNAEQQVNDGAEVAAEGGTGQ